MQSVSLGDNLYEMSKPIKFRENQEKNISLSSAELAQREIKIYMKLYGVLHSSITSYLNETDPLRITS